MLWRRKEPLKPFNELFEQTMAGAQVLDLTGMQTHQAAFAGCLFPLAICTAAEGAREKQAPSGSPGCGVEEYYCM